MTSMIRTLALCVGLLPVAAWAQTQELNALVWCDHTDDALIKPFEKKFGVKVNLKEYEGTGAALSLIEQSQPGDWDVLVIDGIDVPRAVAADILGPLPTDQLPCATLFPELVMDANQTIDGKTAPVLRTGGAPRPWAMASP
jgi:spermidine/putrescine transport system substrate-binding protein